MPNWTDDQKKAIYEKDNNILVAAAAGSGKTAVLVERIINKILNEDVDIDKLLVVTFTNAAASEMRERILDAIYEKLEKDPSNIKLQRQINLLGKASICTMHSFCLDIIRNFFYELDLPANFRIGDSTEVELLKQEVIENLFEQKYIDRNKEFERLLNTYTTYRDDEKLKGMVIKIYEYIQSTPFPKKWLEEKLELLNIKNKPQISYDKTLWGKILIEDYKNSLLEKETKLKGLYEKTSKYPEMYKFSDRLEEDIGKVDEIIKVIELEPENLWDKLCECAVNFKFNNWPSDSKCTNEFKEVAQKERGNIKESIKKLNSKFFSYSSDEANEETYIMYKTLNSLINLIIEFSEQFKKAKIEKNIIDFSDIEHYALEILLKENENGEYVPTEIANKIKDQYLEIAIDEYQDSNLVQESIINSISNGRNVFMVGDVKQSIYRFRQARPDLFLDKYEKYELTGEEKEYKYGKKIKLFKNFRSRKNVLDLCNYIFEQIMTQELGEMDYTEEEYLNPNENYKDEKDIKTFDGKSELYIIDLDNEKQPDIWKNSNEDENDEKIEKTENEEPVENILIESKFVANKIKELMDSGYYVFDKHKGYRRLEYKDIVILLRKTKDVAPIYEKQLLECGIPTFSDSSSEYLDSTEIQTMMCVLKIIDNPLNDIALVTVLRSSIGGFTDNDLVKIRLAERNDCFYYSMLKVRTTVEGNLKNKIDRFFKLLEEWRNDQNLYTLDEFIWKIYEDSNYYNYVGLLNNGKMKQANLRKLFEKAKKFETASFKGLYNFINFIEKIKTGSSDMKAAKIIGENDNVVRIMSVHKSKGLEFPVVFLSGCSKQFYYLDKRDDIYLHQDYGFGAKYIDYEKRIKYNTLIKNAIEIKIIQEMTSEEMRVLYVALTRAREKLYLTGIERNYKKSIEEKKELLDNYNEEKVNISLLKKSKSILDWLELVYLNQEKKLKELITIHKHNFKEIVKNEENVQEEKNLIEVLNKKLEENYSKKKIEEIKEKLNWNYKYQNSVGVITKSSVSKIKKEKILKENEINSNSKIEEFIITENEENLYTNNSINNTLPKPKFYKEDKITSAQKGTLVHLMLQKLNVKKQDYTYQDIKNLIDDLLLRRIITEKEAQAINIDSILQFTKSDLYKEIGKAKKVYKEHPFYINMKAKDIYDTDSEDMILVQGVIDLYFIDENDNIILVDYKTDNVENVEELVEKYKEQLNLYKSAIEKALNKKVDKALIYSIKLQECINI